MGLEVAELRYVIISQFNASSFLIFDTRPLPEDLPLPFRSALPQQRNLELARLRLPRASSKMRIVPAIGFLPKQFRLYLIVQIVIMHLMYLGFMQSLMNLLVG
jgi:hypothetical protein